MDNGASSYRRYLQGDEQGLVEIIRDYKDGLILYLTGFTGNVPEAEELAMDTFVKLGVNRPKDRGTGSFKTWLYTIARNVAVDHLRRRKRQPLSLEDQQQVADLHTLEQSYLQKEERIALYEGILGLKPEYRQILLLVYFEGLSLKEAGLVLHKSTHAAEMLISRARAALKATLGEEFLQ